jgi:hypothetical protein
MGEPGSRRKKKGGLAGSNEAYRSFSSKTGNSAERFGPDSGMNFMDEFGDAPEPHRFVLDLSDVRGRRQVYFGSI